LCGIIRAGFLEEEIVKENRAGKELGQKTWLALSLLWRVRRSGSHLQVQGKKLVLGVSNTLDFPR
jgi:hypothetical protein